MQKKLQEYHACLPMVPKAGLVIPKSQKVVYVPYGFLTFLPLLPIYIDTPCSCLLVVIVNHCAALQLQLGLELDQELELGVELLELVEHLGGTMQDTQQALG